MKTVIQHLWFILLLVAGSVTSAQLQANGIGALQNAQQRSTISLNGQWNRIIDPYENGYYNHRYQVNENGYFKNAKAQNPGDLVEYDFDSAPLIKVPGDWNTQEDELYLYEGTVWYHKRFTINKKQDKRYFMHFGAFNYQAIVYVNGVKVGEHEGGFTSFDFDISTQLNDGDNFVIVKVDNRRERNQIPTVNTDWWNYGGITRSVNIVEVPTRYLADYTVGLSDDSTKIQGQVTVAGSANQADSAVVLNIPELNIKQKLKLNKDGSADFSIAAKPQLWSPDSPKLYAVELSFNGEVVQDKIGFRSIKVAGTDILLNGKSMFLRGISIHEESPLSGGRAWSEEDARTLLTWAKELGCNFVRLAHYPHNETMLRMADEMGLLVWSEIPVYWTVMFEDQAVYKKAESQLTEMINRDKNRAAIMMWSVANETPSHQARLIFLTNLIKTARKLDPSRLITAAMDTQSNSANGKLIDDPLANEVDIIGVNSYCGWYGGTPASCADLKWQSHYSKPIIMSEMGAGALQGLHGDKGQRWTEEYQADVYRNNLTMIDNMSALRGVTPWILKDFRSPRRPLNNIQDFWNRKGLVSETGVRKQAWYVLHDYYFKKSQQN